MKSGIIIPSRLLPKTGQVTSYEDNDDGDIQAGWWKGLSDFSNKTRFINKTIDGDILVIDNATGLTWPSEYDSSICNNGDSLNWADAIDYPIGRSFGGFSDWRLPNEIELLSIINFSTFAPAIYSTFFTSDPTEIYWTSNTSSWDISSGFAISFFTISLAHFPKITLYKIRPVRGGV